MTHISTTDLLEALEDGETNYLEVLSEESVDVELARYPNDDPKTTHKADELYVILSGAGKMYVGNERYTVEKGDVIYVKQDVEHDFFDIEKEITALVVFTGFQESVLGRKA